MASGERGALQLGSFPTAGARILPRVLAELTRVRPGIEITLSEGEPDELLPELLDGDLDLLPVYRYDLFPRAWPDQLVETPVMDEHFVLCVPAGHPLARGRRRPAAGPAVGDLDREPPRQLRRAGAAAAVRSGRVHAVCGLVGFGLGIALVPALGRVPAPGLRTLRPGPRGPRRHVTVLRRATNTNPLVKDAVRGLTDVARRVQAEITLD